MTGCCSACGVPFRQDTIAPDRFATDEFVLRPITVADAELDYEAVMESRELLRLWEQSSWPADDFTVEDNRLDLEKMERRHAAGAAFGYTMLDPDESICLGCVYVFAPDARFLAAADITAVTDAAWERIDAAVYFWVRTSRLAAGLDRSLLTNLRRWFAEIWGLFDVVFVTSELLTQQVQLLEGTDLELRFQIAEADKPGCHLAYG
jgi:hypothetical protein